MASILTKLAPILVLVAFVLQGCIFSDFKPAVKIAIGHQCHEKVSQISDAEGLKDVHAAEACNDLDQAELTKFKVTDCKQVLHDVMHFFLGAICEFGVTTSASGSCKPFSGADCKKAVDTAVQSFDPSDIPESEADAVDTAMEDGFEAVLGLVTHCGAAVSTASDSDNSQKEITDLCAETSENAMSTMGVGDDHCKDYLKQNMLEIGVIACIASAMTRDDVPDSPEAVTAEWMEKASTEFGEKLAKDFMATAEETLSQMGPDRLRLFQVVRQGKWTGKFRRGPPAMMAAWVASALTLVALLGVAWRCRSTRQPALQDTEPILDGELQSAE